MRMFNGLLFQGAGWHSGLALLALEKKFYEACALAGGLQQPPSIHDPPDDPDQVRELELDLEEMVREIAMALTGRDISFGRQMPYPPDNLNEVDPKELFDAIKAAKENRRQYETSLMREIDKNLNPDDTERRQRERLEELRRRKAQRYFEDRQMERLEDQLGERDYPKL